MKLEDADRLAASGEWRGSLDYFAWLERVAEREAIWKEMGPLKSVTPAEFKDAYARATERVRSRGAGGR